MPTINLIKGLEILLKHHENPSGCHISAAHDVIYGHTTETPLSVIEVQEMVDLGWFQDDCDEDDTGYSPEDYNPDEGWCFFT